MSKDDSRPLTRDLAPFGVRMPPDLKARVQAAAEANNRSMNAEIVAVLEEKYPFRNYAGAFERGVEALFLDFGWTVETGMSVQRLGIDMIASKGRLSVAVECKARMASVTPGIVERTFKAKQQLQATASAIIGIGPVESELTRKRAKELQVLLFDAEDESAPFPVVLEDLGHGLSSQNFLPKDQ